MIDDRFIPKDRSKLRAPKPEIEGIKGWNKNRNEKPSLPEATGAHVDMT